jgi:hypothetical protein
MVAPGCGAIGSGEKGGKASRELREGSSVEDSKVKGATEQHVSRGRKRGATEVAVGNANAMADQRERGEAGVRPEKRRTFWQRIMGLWQKDQSS